jgi:hypothetical protein
VVALVRTSGFPLASTIETTRAWKVETPLELVGRSEGSGVIEIDRAWAAALAPWEPARVTAVRPESMKSESTSREAPLRKVILTFPPPFRI